jgi:multiple sugar transport system substrate-binding protein
MRTKSGISALCACLIFLVLAACGGGSGEPSASPPEGGDPLGKPVTLTLFNGQPGALDLERLGITDALKKKFPNLTLNILLKGPNTDYKNLIADGTLPDIIYESASFTVDRIMQNGFHYEMDDLLKKHNFDLNVFEPNVLAQTRYATGLGKTYGLPFTMNRYALFYNKDLFDKFGVPYPKDGMTWDDIYELAKRLTRSDQGTQYMGFATTPNNMMLNNQLSLGPLDPKQDKASLNTDGWKLLFENLKRFYEIPNNELLPTSEVGKGFIAMAVESHPPMISWAKANPEMRWDVVSVPVLKEKPNTGLKPATLSLFVTQTSQHKDEAFQVVAYLVSKEVQTLLARQGVGTPLADAEVKKAFGQNVPELKDKNTGAFYYYQDAPPSPLRDPNLTSVGVDFAAPFADMIKNKTDVNTVLRTFEEQINQKIEEAKAEKSK